jgi:hypothetical protein
VTQRWEHGHRRGWPTAAALSTLAHVVMLAAILAGLRMTETPTPTPTIQLELEPPATPPLPPRPQRRATTSVRRAAAPVPEAVPTPSVAAPSPIATPVGGPGAVPPPPSGLVAGLRGSVGCANAARIGLSADERARCERRFAGAAESGGRTFETDAAKVLAFEEAGGPLRGDFIARRPKTGCRIRASPEVIAAPQAGRAGVTAGVTCVFRF